MLNSLKKKFQNLPPEKQKNLSRMAVIGILVLVSLAGYYTSKGHKVKKPEQGESFQDLNPNLGYLQKSLYYEVTNQMKKMERRLKEMQLEVKSLKNKVENTEASVSEKIESLQKKKEKKAPTFNAIFERRKKQGAMGIPVGVTVPQPPKARAGPTQRRARTAAVPSRSGGQASLVGDVGSVSRAAATPQGRGTRTKKEKAESDSVYLPPSFMEADLISGFAAPTMEAARSEPVQTFLRIRDLAVLPNRVKSDLKGCFAIAEAYGNLSDERAHLRLLRLSCIARDGSAVIDESIKGFVVDEDGRIGLKGRVVSKMGSLLARSVAASFLQGFGDAYGQSSYTQVTSGLGTTTTLNPSDAFKAGIGRGIAEGPKQLAKFYLELAKQTFPVIEVGAGKRVTLVINTGVDLKIREKCLGGKDGCEEKTDSYDVLAGF